MSEELTKQEDLITRTVVVREPCVGVHDGLADITLLPLPLAVKDLIYDTYNAKARSKTLKACFIQCAWPLAYVPTPLL
jgi:hypothetical protein